ncbi:MAG: restriction endonuclease subunit S [Arcobacter sp.]|nr:restriction endonuclease subunit S [Arcobacter sp.]|tara:strand:- start:13201 stop:14523 length:1323 start_codon:yes stop_codon:yes gene_type:complete
MKYKKYSKYKDSGIKWLGSIPEHWKVNSLKSLLKERKENNNPIKTSNILSLCMYKGVIPYSEKGNSGNKSKDDLTAYKLAYPGDIVLNSMNVIAGSVGLSKYFGAVSPVYYMLRPRNNENSVEYFNNIFQSESFQKSLYGLGNGIMIKESINSGKLNTIRMRIPMDKLNSVLLPNPEKSEQKLIADFLDKKSAEIDILLKNQTKLIELLKEKKQSVISDAVTKGINSNVKRKNSGVKWLGKIPEHWKIVQSRRLFEARKEKIRKGDEQLTASQKHGVIYQKEFMRLEGRKVTLVLKGSEILKHVEAGDFVISMRSFQGGLELCKYSGSVSSAYIGLIPIKHVVHDYFKYLFKSVTYIQALQSTSNLVRDGQALRFENFSQVDLVIVPEKEQQQIANYLDEKTSTIDKLIEKANKSIILLKEKRTALISAAVTGKIDVREL